jgi:hypothetical protein
MLRFRTSLPRLRVAIVTLVSVCVLVLGVGAVRKCGYWPGKHDGTVRVQNKTRSFELTQLRRNRRGDKGGPELSLRNGYDRNITAYAVSVNGAISIADLVQTDDEDRRAIAPGALFTNEFSYVDRSVSPAVAAQQDFDINVLAVVLDDGSGDGDEKLVAGILYERLKSKLLLARIVDLLNRDLNSLQIIDDTVFDGLRYRVSSLDTDSQDSGEKDDVVRWFGELDPSLSPRERIIRVKGICESLIARL